MRIFFFNLDGYRRYIDLDQIQVITDLNYEERPESYKLDKDGIQVLVPYYCAASFDIQLAFQEKPMSFRFYKHGDHDEASPKAAEAAIIAVRKFKAEYDRLVTFWRMAETPCHEWKPST